MQRPNKALYLLNFIISFSFAAGPLYARGPEPVKRFLFYLFRRVVRNILRRNSNIGIIAGCS